MTVKRAREILKDKISHMSDSEVEEMIARDMKLTRTLFDIYFLTAGGKNDDNRGSEKIDNL